MPARRQSMHRRMIVNTLTAAVASIAASISLGATGDEAQARITADVAAGRPVVVHVIVALCDNENQGIVPVPRHLGNGQDARSNLYWGALFGVRTYFVRQGGWTSVSVEKPSDTRIRERAVFVGTVQRAGRPASVHVVADAWDGAEIKAAIERFLSLAAGGATEQVSLGRGAEARSITAGGSAHVVAFVGHDGLMDFSLRGPDKRVGQAPPNSSIVLACASKPYFLDKLRAAGSHPLLLTTGLMAPEAYTLDAAIRSWIGGASVDATREAAATAYQRYQKCGMRAARNLFWGEP